MGRGFELRTFPMWFDVLRTELFDLNAAIKFLNRHYILESSTF